MGQDFHLERQRAVLRDAEARGMLPALGAYARFSGPGWLTSALTLGAGSLGSSLYLGILAGVGMVWIQPYAMAMGVVMLGAISYVTLSIDESPFRAMNKHVNPLLGWSWLAAALVANVVWSMPQYGLTFAVMEQNLAPSWFGSEGWLGDGDGAKYAVSLAAFAACTAVAWSYGSGSAGVRWFDRLLKLVVAIIVLSFIGVVVRIATTGDGIEWGVVLAGVIPSPRNFTRPAVAFEPLLAAIGDTGTRTFWHDLIVSQQRDVMLGAGSAAVGVNMTYMLPTLLRTRGWGREFRRLELFDLATAMFLPFVIATGCVIVASAHQFHAQVPGGFGVDAQGEVVVPERFRGEYAGMMASRSSALAASRGDVPPPAAEEEQLAAMLVRRDASDLAQSLVTLFGGGEESDGRFVANVVFGVGVAGMTVSSIALMMLISGFIVCDATNAPIGGWRFRLGCLVPSIALLWPVVWQGATKAWLTVAASVVCASLLPIAYVAFLLLMNRRELMGAEMLVGWKRLVVNLLMCLAAASAIGAAISAVLKTSGWPGMGVVAGYLIVLLVVGAVRRTNQTRDAVRAKLVRGAAAESLT
ncbi:MAG: divalent metal cation transporter [Pirellulales bacterium]|nr:divalent metal cation transporter [Pirellulales bacterium]